MLKAISAVQSTKDERRIFRICARVLIMKENIKRILVPLDPSVYAQAATETACRIAQKSRAQVAGVAVLDSDEIRSSVVPAVGPYYPMLIDDVRKKTEHADDVLRDCMERFAQTCEQMRVAHLETEYEGIPVQKLLESAIFFDLIVVGIKTAFHFETRQETFQEVDRLLDRTITPILAVPATGLEKPEKVLIAFDGSFGSARALHDFAAFAQPYDFDCKIVVAGKEDDEADFLLKHAAAFLRSHGIENIETEATSESIGEVANQSIAGGVNLIVAGIHSKKFINDLFVGSFTKDLIREGDVSLFLSH